MSVSFKTSVLISHSQYLSPFALFTSLIRPQSTNNSLLHSPSNAFYISINSELLAFSVAHYTHFSWTVPKPPKLSIHTHNRTLTIPRKPTVLVEVLIYIDCHRLHLPSIRNFICVYAPLRPPHRPPWTAKPPPNCTAIGCNGNKADVCELLAVV